LTKIETFKINLSIKEDPLDRTSKWSLIAVCITLLLFGISSFVFNAYPQQGAGDIAGSEPNNSGNTSSTTTSFYSQELIGKGAALNNLDRYDKTITYIDKSLAIDPNNESVLLIKGVPLDNNLHDTLISISAYPLTQDTLDEIRDNLMEVRLSLQKGDLIEALQHLNNAEEELLLLQTNHTASISNNTTIKNAA
jgi:tetratricopeptide (TPR) repeat protein